VTPLDNPMWEALTSGHAGLAIAHGSARRYPYEIARFAGLATPGAVGDLEPITEPGDVVAFFTTDALALPGGWSLLQQRTIEQMIAGARLPAPRHELVPLADDDVPEMLELAALTQPGPFFARTIETGRYFGVKVDGRLAAMAGERLRLSDFTEISAVCTHPDHQGHGYGRSLVAALVNLTLDEGRAPFLHVKQENGARALYEKLGFTTRADMYLTISRRA
jgi:ribosomal protein S18 acetylase RimI-like enzyme